ncbi:peroxiredoxin [Moraxella marmotae]|uniref:peroxiredoxin n=1 Tax=Moraxella marmotae TaxID=3344520 RepID=UPI0035F3F6BB
MLKNSNENIALPDFELELIAANAQQTINLKSLITDNADNANNKGLILYFYPKDNTQGCSVQAIDFSADVAAFDALGYRIIGVSRDGVKSHQNFINKKQLSIELISDGDEKLCQHYDVIKEKMMYGKTHLGVVRSTFVYDKTGQMIGSFRNVKAKEHVANLLSFLQQYTQSI